MASISVRVGIYAVLFSAVTNHLPPYDTPHAAPCNKAEFHVRHRHAAGGVCEQKIGSTKIYIYVDNVIPHILPAQVKQSLIKHGEF